MGATYIIIGAEAEWYDMGMMAFDEGLNIEDNPFKEASKEYAYWQRGFEDAQED